MLLDDGAVLERRAAFHYALSTAVNVTGADGAVAAGFADGSVQLGAIGVSVEFAELLHDERERLQEARVLGSRVRSLAPVHQIGHALGCAHATRALEIPEPLPSWWGSAHRA